MLNATIEQEIAELSRRFGTPLRRSVPLSISSLFDPLGKTDRYGEVCMVIRRPNGRLITSRKTYYPRNGFRLLTGGINHGESIFDALLRETAEETGLAVEVRHFLAVVRYEPTIARPNDPPFTTFAFLLDEIGGELACADPDERVDSFREVRVDELPQIADTLDHIEPAFDHEINGNWVDWGRFRAVIHRVVYAALIAPHDRDVLAPGADVGR